MQFIIRLLATAAALWVAVEIVPGLTYTGDWVGLLGVAVVFGLVNAIIRPILAMLTCPLVLLTLGLFVFVLNALMLWLTSVIAESLGLNFQVDGFLAAFVGALIVGVVSTVLNVLVGEKKERA
jgi:putative membrane protein